MRRPEGKRASGGGGAVSGSMDHSEKSPGLSLEERRQIVHEIAQCLDDAPAVLNSFKKKELLELICAEVGGKERKFSGFTKPKMIEYLLKSLSKKCKKETETVTDPPSPMLDENKPNKQQKNKYLSQLPIESSYSDEEMVREDPKDLLCGNLACRAPIGADDIFCKRCSCCICHQYDENKDPSLWLTCDFNSLEAHNPCGISCHLKCALDQKSADNLKKDSGNPDDYFRCVFCGTPYGVMRTWRKQMVAAAEARRVDVLCIRLALAHKILIGGNKYEGLLKMVESAVTALENEVGPVQQASVTMDRSIVNRLSCGASVQKLCTSALEDYDSMMGGQHLTHADEKEDPITYLLPLEKEDPECKILIEVISPTQVAVNLEYDDLVMKDLSSCRIWHERSGTDYPNKPTYKVAGPVKRFVLCNLDPSTEYSCIAALYNKGDILGAWETSWRTPALSEDQAATHDNANAQMRTESMSSSDELSKEPSVLFDFRKKNGGLPPSILPFPKKPRVSITSPTSNAPSTPSKSDGTQEVPHSGNQRQSKESDYEYAVRVIRKLEHEGHLESDFRVKFLTWFSLKATLQEKRVVSVYIDTFSDDPPSLAGQLLDTFKDRICTDRKLASPRFCTRLWH